MKLKVSMKTKTTLKYKKKIAILLTAMGRIKAKLLL